VRMEITVDTVIHAQSNSFILR